jgi:hypothetical protein
VLYKVTVTERVLSNASWRSPFPFGYFVEHVQLPVGCSSDSLGSRIRLFGNGSVQWCPLSSANPVNKRSPDKLICRKGLGWGTIITIVETTAPLTNYQIYTQKRIILCYLRFFISQFYYFTYIIILLSKVSRRSWKKTRGTQVSNNCFKEQWHLYLPPALALQTLYLTRSVCLRFMWFTGNTATVSLNNINRLASVMEKKYVPYEVQTQL